jgi:hypothetical protein
MQDEVSRNLRGMVLRRERMRFSRTLKGRLWNFAGCQWPLTRRRSRWTAC